MPLDTLTQLDVPGEPIGTGCCRCSQIRDGLQVGRLNVKRIVNPTHHPAADKRVEVGGRDRTFVVVNENGEWTSRFSSYGGCLGGRLSGCFSRRLCYPRRFRLSGCWGRGCGWVPTSRQEQTD